MKKELEERLRQNEEEMDAMKKSWEQRLKEVQTAQEVKEMLSQYKFNAV